MTVISGRVVLTLFNAGRRVVPKQKHPDPVHASIFSSTHQLNDFEGCFNVHCSWSDAQRLFLAVAVRRIETVTVWSPIHEMAGNSYARSRTR